MKNALFFLLFIATLGLVSCAKSTTVDPAEQFVADKAAIAAYAKAKGLTVTTSNSGLSYVITKEGTGPNPTSSSKVTVTYKGYKLDGTVFDQSTAPVPFGLNQVIQGWTEGITYLKKGGSGILLIPSALAYGSTGSGSIPANTPLIFEVQLISFQ